MPLFNHPDFFTNHQLDLENKLVLPTSQLYNQAKMQLNALYLDIRSALIDTHSVIATAAKQLYDQPIATLIAWYGQAEQTSSVFYAQAQTIVLPVYQDWQNKLSVGNEKAGQYLQAFWENPEQVAAATLEPVTGYVVAAAEQSGQYWRLFMENPEQFLANALVPVNNYLDTLTEAAAAALISSYYALAELSGLLMAQPSATLQALYRNTLSALLEVYFEAVSSLLAMA